MPAPSRSPGLGTGSPEQVGAAVVKVIERDKLEVAVGPLRQRVLAHFALSTPGISVKIASGDAGQAAAVAQGQLDKRCRRLSSWPSTTLAAAF